MSLLLYFTCNCCLFAQDLEDEIFDGVHLGIPDTDKEAFIDCHYNLHKPVLENMPEFNLKHRQSVGCHNWTCGKCGLPFGSISHEGCWK